MAPTNKVLDGGKNVIHIQMDFVIKIYEISAVAKAVEGPLGEPIEPTLVRCPW